MKILYKVSKNLTTLTYNIEDAYTDSPDLKVGDTVTVCAGLETYHRISIDAARKFVEGELFTITKLPILESGHADSIEELISNISESRVAVTLTGERTVTGIVTSHTAGVSRIRWEPHDAMCTLITKMEDCGIGHDLRSTISACTDLNDVISSVDYASLLYLAVRGFNEFDHIVNWSRIPDRDVSWVRRMRPDKARLLPVIPHG